MKETGSSVGFRLRAPRGAHAASFLAQEALGQIALVFVGSDDCFLGSFFDVSFIKLDLHCC